MLFDSRQKKFLSDHWEWIADTSLDEPDPLPESTYLLFLRFAFETLPAKQADILRLYFSEQIKVPEIAKHMGIHKSTAYRRLNAGIHALKSLAQICRKTGLFHL